jgi:cyclopropane fatty-acyl-phospholipid synthase-like methyltransferase
MLILIILLFALVPVVMVWFLLQGAPFVRTSDRRKRLIIQAATQAKPKRTIDLGCGDGSLVIALARAGFRADGVEIQPWLVIRARRKVKKLGLENKVTIYWGSFWNIDVSKYNMVVLFGAQHIMSRLERKLLKELEPNSYIVSNTFIFPNLKLVYQDGKIRTYRI